MERTETSIARYKDKLKSELGEDRHTCRIYKYIICYEFYKKSSGRNISLSTYMDRLDDDGLDTLYNRLKNDDANV